MRSGDAEVNDEREGKAVDAAVGHLTRTLRTPGAHRGGGGDLGWNVGTLYRVLDNLSVGLSYRSEVRCDLEGSSKATGPLAQGYTAPDIGDVGEGVCPRKVLGCRARAASSDERRNPERETLAKPPSKCD